MSDPDQEFSRLFRFKLDPRTVGDHARALEDLVRQHLQELLAIVELYEGERKVDVDRFQFINEINAHKLIYPPDIEDAYRD